MRSVLYNRQKFAQEAVLASLKDEHRVILSIATSRAKLVMRNMSGTKNGVDAFDVAELLGRLSRGVTNARPVNILERKWGRRAATSQTSSGDASSISSVDSVLAPAAADERGYSTTDAGRPPTLFADAAADSRRRITELMGALSACVSEAEFVHEFGAIGTRSIGGAGASSVGGTSRRPIDKGMMSLLPGEVRHTLGKAGGRSGGSSAAHELVKLGRSILADTVAVEKSTSQIAGNLVDSPW